MLASNRNFIPLPNFLNYLILLSNLKRKQKDKNIFMRKKKINIFKHEMTDRDILKIDTHTHKSDSA